MNSAKKLSDKKLTNTELIDKDSNKPKIKVYFDGLCYLCSREINHYKKMNGAKENIIFIDITSQTFKALEEGVDPIKVHKTMHVKDKHGELQLGVDAFICIWKELNALRFLVPIAKFLPVHLVLRLFYSLFAFVRPILPRKSCEDSPYCETNLKP